ncbi:phosphopantetheine-binding protein [Corallococcus soli]
MDALARRWSAAGEAVLSVQWGAWSEGGMAARHDAVRRAEAGGFGSISDALGTAVLSQLLAGGKRGTVCATPIDWDRLQWEMPLVSRLRPKRSASTGPTHSEPASTHVSAEELLAIVRQAATELVGRPIADDASLLESGLDSLGSVSLRNRLASRLGVELSSAFVLECPSVSAMVRYLSSLSPRAASRPVPAVSHSQLPVLVIGAGIGGLSFARQLEKAGTSVVVMDAAARVGGVWQSLANASSKLQIDSPAYDFDSTAMPLPGDHSWKTSFPSQAEILTGCQSMAADLMGPVYLEARVQSVRKVDPSEYEVTYSRAGRTQRMRVSGVAAMTGGLHRPRRHTFPGEEAFGGHIGLGVANDTPLERFRGASVVIVGHGAFAVENMRTALENGARHVTLLCRQQHMVLSTFCNWLLNSSKGVMPVSDVVDVMRPFYAACGVEVQDLHSLARDAAGEWTLDQATVPPGSDLYFLAQMMGKLRIVVGEAAGFTSNSVLTQDGQELAAEVFLKCLGSHTDDSVLLGLFGEGSRVQGLWINGDPNLITYNDGAQVPRKVKSLMCASYAFFVQAFAPAYLHFRAHPDEHARALARLTSATPTSTDAERVLLELWDFLEPTKRVLAERTLELLPFDRFQVERENEWERYSRMLGGTGEEGLALWQLLRPTLSLVHRRNPQAPVEMRSRHPVLGSLSVFVPRSQRVLFLPGQGTNARLARTLLERTGWIDRSRLDFVVPDAPYEMPAFTNELQLEQVGLSNLVSAGLYDKTARYREWRAGFEALYQQHHHGKAINVTDVEREQWRVTLAYLREIVERYGPFDGIAGFCEGAAVASVALHLQARGEDHGLGSVRFFIAMAPWRSPMHQQEGMFRPGQPLKLPMLQIVGDNDMDVFLGAAPHFYADFAGASEFRHPGQHVYPPLTPGLEVKLRQLINASAVA